MSQQDPAVPATSLEHAEALGMNKLWDNFPELRDKIRNLAPFCCERNNREVVVSIPAGEGVLKTVVVHKNGEVTPYPDN